MCISVSPDYSRFVFFCQKVKTEIICLMLNVQTVSKIYPIQVKGSFDLNVFLKT